MVHAAASDMTEVFYAALEMQAFLRFRGWPFCFIGGVAVQRWGEQRSTDDVDLTLLTGFSGEEVFVDELLRHFPGRRAEERTAALASRVVFLVTSNGVNADVALGAISFEEDAVNRSSEWELSPGNLLRTCSSEDLLVHKCFANRDRDWTDVEGILIRQWGNVDMKLVRRELHPLAELKESPDILQRLDKLLARLGQSKVLPKWDSV